jgi:imidazolonepropionase-like amidohydrolase
MRIAIRTGRFYDGTTTPPRDNVTLVLENGRVARIDGAEGRVEADRTYEAPAVVPGLINSHVHLEVNGEPDTMGFYVVRNAKQRALYAATNARLALHAGVTTVRDLGASDGQAIELREAIARGEHVGPTIIAAGQALCITGGHGFFLGRETDGPWDARKGVREQRKAGADCIKLVATGGVLTKGAVPGLDQLSEEEMRAAIEEATTHGMRVAAHAIGTNGIKNALRAGVTSIEHGHLLDDEAIALFKESGAYLVPTLAAVACIYENIGSGSQPDFVVRKATDLYARAQENLRRA